MLIYNKKRKKKPVMKKFLKVFDYIATIMFSFFIILSCLFISIIPIASDSSYYMKQYERNGVGPYLSEYSISQLKEVTDSITSYLFKGKEESRMGKNCSILEEGI